MSFNFSKVDKISELPEPIKIHLKTFITNRINQYELLSEAVSDQDFEEIRLFCHAQLGVAGSYHCYKLEEITAYIQDYARKEEMEPIQEAMTKLKNYLEELKAAYY